MKIELVLNFIATIALIISVYKTKDEIKSFFPFYIFALIGLANDIISKISIIIIHTNSINSNIYVLLSSILIIYQLQIWNRKTVLNYVYLLCYTCITLIWITDNLILSNLMTFNIYNRILIYIIIVSFCIKLLSPFSIKNHTKIKQDGIFIITAILVIKYSIYIISEILWASTIQLSPDFRLFFFNAMVFSNPIINLLLAAVFLWIRKKSNIMLQQQP